MAALTLQPLGAGSPLGSFERSISASVDVTISTASLQITANNILISAADSTVEVQTAALQIRTNRFVIVSAVDAVELDKAIITDYAISLNWAAQNDKGVV